MTNEEIAREVVGAYFRLDPSIFPAGVARRVFPALLLLLEDSIAYYGYDQFELSLDEIATFSRLLADDAGDSVEWRTAESVRQAYYKFRSAFPVSDEEGRRRVRLRIELLPTERMLFAAELWIDGIEEGPFHVRPTPDVVGARMRATDLFAFANALSGRLQDNMVIHAGRMAISASLLGTPVRVVVNHPYTFGHAADDLMIDWGDGTPVRQVKGGRPIRHIFSKEGGPFTPRFRWRRDGVWRESSLPIIVIPASPKASEELRLAIREELRATRWRGRKVTRDYR